MIRSFACADTEALFHSRAVSRFRNIERVARRKLLQIHAATELASLRIPPGNQPEALRADRKGQHCHPTQRIPSARRDRQRPESFKTTGKPFAGSVQVAGGVFNVPEQMFSLSDDIHVASAVGKRQDAVEPRACAPEFSLRVPHHSRSRECSQLGRGRW